MVPDSNMVTINDVAKAAGVSKGTVDRVIHNRGEVSAKSREKVLRVIEELGYKPNMYASMLATHRKITICCIIPEYGEGDFWELAAKGIHEAGESVSGYGVVLEIVTYDQYDMNSFSQACLDALEKGPDGVVIAPIFHAETMAFTQEMSRRGISYAYIDSRLEEDPDYMAYFGMPMVQSGYLCADILTNELPVDKVYVIRIAHDKTKNSDQTWPRRAGFVKYMSEHYPDAEIVNVVIDPKDAQKRFDQLDEAFSSDQGPKFITMFNSRIHLVADYIRVRGMKDCRVVGFDCIERNLQALKDRVVHALIAQHMDRQTSAAVLALVDKLIHGVEVSKKDHFTSMDILNRFNCDYYM